VNKNINIFIHLVHAIFQNHYSLGYLILKYGLNVEQILQRIIFLPFSIIVV
jgi:hypothetical protein